MEFSYRLYLVYCQTNVNVLFIPGIEGAFSAPGGKTVIPRKVIGKFSIRLVPNMLPDEICRLVTEYIEKLHKKSGSPNSIK